MSEPSDRSADPGTARLAGTMFVAGILSAVILVGANELTAPIIARNKKEALERAAVEVVPGSARAKPVPGADGLFACYGEDDRLVGYALKGQGIGFMDVIELVVGYSPGTRRLTGFKVLQSKETPGLGDKIMFQPFVGRFEGLAVPHDGAVGGKVAAVKPGTAEKTKDVENDVDTISGATISSKAVVKIVNTSLETWLPRIHEGAPGAPGKEGQ